IHRGRVVELALGSTEAAPALVQPSRRFGLHRRRTSFRSAWASHRRLGHRRIQRLVTHPPSLSHGASAGVVAVNTLRRSEPGAVWSGQLRGFSFASGPKPATIAVGCATLDNVKNTRHLSSC